MTGKEEIIIIHDCQSGHLEKFGILYQSYIRKIYDFIYYKTLNKEVAEDLTSTTFLKALKNINNFQTNKGQFSSWLYRIARNNVIDYYRTKKTEFDVNEFWDLTDKNNTEFDFEAKQKIEKVEKYLKQLPPEQREIVIMRVWNEMSYQEIAEVLDKSEASCKMLFSRTINKLRVSLPLTIYILTLINPLK